MEFQILKYRKLIAVAILAFFAVSCEKEIKLDLPPSKTQWVVEASINQRFPTLNYVYISRTLDYFNPDLSLNGVRGATVYITEGNVVGSDTIFDPTNRVAFTNFFDSIVPGIYVNLNFMAKLEKPYLLEITMPNGDLVTGKTYVRTPPTIDSISYNIIDTNAFLYFEWFDGPEQNNYRLALWNFPDSNLTGWGAANRFYTFDDQFINNAKRPFQLFNPFDPGDTINIYLASIGRPEFVFWDTFRRANNNGGPFATPITVTSNVTNAIGSFTGYGIHYQRIILKP